MCGPCNRRGPRLSWICSKQKVGTLAVIVLIPALDCNAYLEDPSVILSLLVFCPLCSESEVEHRLALNGGYSRGIPVEKRFESGWIYRKLCSRCGVSFSLLPAFLLPFLGYSRSLVVWWLWACLWGVSSRNRSFLTKRGLECPTPVDDASWTDLLEFRRSRPGYALLCRWARTFSSRAREAVPGLLCAFVFQRCDLRLDLAAWLRPMHHVPSRVRPLALALGLWRALLDSMTADGRRVSLKFALPSLLDYLLPPSSHGLIRAFGPMLDYDGDSLAVRGPPCPTELEEQLSGRQDL